MKNYIAVGIFVVLILTLGFFIGKSCADKEVIVKTDFDKTVKVIDEKISVLQDSINAIAKQRIVHKTFNKYETIKIDSLIQLDSSWVNAIIRARIERLYQLPEFFTLPFDPNRTINNPEGSTSW